MAEMDDKISSILNNPQLMQQIMTMAQSLGNTAQPQEKPSQETPRQDFSLPDIDLATVQKITGLAKQSSIDKREQALLRALGAYLSKDRMGKLEKAMRAAKMAKIASSALSQRRQSSYSGR